MDITEEQISDFIRNNITGVIAKRVAASKQFDYLENRYHGKVGMFTSWPTRELDNIYERALIDVNNKIANKNLWLPLVEKELEIQEALHNPDLSVSEKIELLAQADEIKERYIKDIFGVSDAYDSIDDIQPNRVASSLTKRDYNKYYDKTSMRRQQAQAAQTEEEEWVTPQSSTQRPAQPAQPQQSQPAPQRTTPAAQSTPAQPQPASLPQPASQAEQPANEEGRPAVENNNGTPDDGPYQPPFEDEPIDTNLYPRATSNARWPAMRFPENGMANSVADFGKNSNNAAFEGSALPSRNIEDIQGQGEREDAWRETRASNQSDKMEQYIDSMTDDGSVLSQSQLEEEARIANPDADEEEIKNIVNKAVAYQQKKRRDQADARAAAARNEAGSLYQSAAKGIWPAYFDKEIDLPTAGFLTLDTLSKKLRSVGNSIGNIGRAWVGGSQLPDDSEKSLWEKRRDAIWQNAIDTEIGKQPGSFANLNWRERDSKASISESEATMKKIDADMYKEFQKLKYDSEKTDNRIKEIEAEVRAGTASPRIQKEYADLMSVKLANESAAIINQYKEKGIRNELKAQELSNKSQEIKNAIDHITEMNESERQRLGLDTQIEQLTGLQIANAINKVNQMVAEGTTDAQIERYILDNVPRQYAEAMTAPLIQYYHDHPGKITNKEAFNNFMSYINGAIQPVSTVVGAASQVVGIVK